MRRLAFTTMYTPSSFAALVIVGVEVGVLRGVKDSIVMTIEDSPPSHSVVFSESDVAGRRRCDVLLDANLCLSGYGILVVKR